MEDERIERILEAVAALSEEQRQRLLRSLAQTYGPPEEPEAVAVPLSFKTTQVAGTLDYSLLFDGGSRGNPGPGYGSYRLTRVADGRFDIVRLDFGRTMTNNEAEYAALIAALEGLIERVRVAGRDPADFTVEVRGDSALVIRQVEGTWKVRDERMRALRNQARELLACFQGYRLVLQGREETVCVLGH